MLSIIDGVFYCMGAIAVVTLLVFKQPHR